LISVKVWVTSGKTTKRAVVQGLNPTENEVFEDGEVGLFLQNYCCVEKNAQHALSMQFIEVTLEDTALSLGFAPDFRWGQL
jgi:hypothetical protein